MIFVRFLFSFDMFEDFPGVRVKYIITNGWKYVIVNFSKSNLIKFWELYGVNNNGRNNN